MSDHISIAEKRRAHLRSAPFIRDLMERGRASGLDVYPPIADDDFVDALDAMLGHEPPRPFVPCRLEYALLNLSNTLDRTVANQLLGWMRAAPPVPAITPDEAFAAYIAVMIRGRARTVMLRSIARRERFDREARAAQSVKQARAVRAMARSSEPEIVLLDSTTSDSYGAVMEAARRAHPEVLIVSASDIEGAGSSAASALTREVLRG